MLAEALPALEQAAGGRIDGRVASSPNAYDDIVAELASGDYAEIILHYQRPLPGRMSAGSSRIGKRSRIFASTAGSMCSG